MIDYTPVPELCTTNLIVPRWVVRNTRWEQRLKQGLDARDRDAEKLADRCVAAGLPGPFMLCTGSWGRWLEWENHTHRLEVQPHYPTGLGNPTVLQVSLTRLPPLWARVFVFEGRDAIKKAAAVREANLL